MIVFFIGIVEWFLSCPGGLPSGAGARHAFGLPFLFAPVDVVEIGAVLVVFEVPQGGGLHADVELPAFTRSGRYPRKNSSASSAGRA